MALTKITGEGVGAVDNLTVSTAASTTAEIRLTSNNTGSGSGDRGRIAVYSSRNDGTAYEAGRIDIDRSSGTEDKAHIQFFTNDGSGASERLRVLSGGGLTFNGDTAEANALDDYEEGTWTPQISATDGIGTLTYAAQVGRYTKVGNRVSFNLYVAISSKGTVAGNLRFTLPFTVKSVASNYSVFSWFINSAASGQRFDGDTMQFCFASANSSIALPYGSNGSGGLDHLNANHVQNNTDFMVGGTYEV